MLQWSRGVCRDTDHVPIDHVGCGAPYHCAWLSQLTAFSGKWPQKILISPQQVHVFWWLTWHMIMGIDGHVWHFFQNFS